MPDRRDLVINTGPLLALIAAGQLDTLRGLFQRIVVPDEVCREIAAGGRTQFTRAEFAAATWLDRRGAPKSAPKCPSRIPKAIRPGPNTIHLPARKRLH